MSGEWIKRRSNEHKCERPRHEELGERVANGDQWQCECGRIWRVRSVWRGDQREPLQDGGRPVISWEIYQ